MGMDAAAGFDLRILIFTLHCDIFDQAWTLLKYWKNVNSDFTINLNFAFTVFNFLSYSE